MSISRKLNKADNMTARCKYCKHDNYHIICEQINPYTGGSYFEYKAMLNYEGKCKQYAHAWWYKIWLWISMTAWDDGRRISSNAD